MSQSLNPLHGRYQYFSLLLLVWICQEFQIWLNGSCKLFFFVVNFYFHLSKLILIIASFLILLSTELFCFTESVNKNSFCFQKFRCNFFYFLKTFFIFRPMKKNYIHLKIYFSNFALLKLFFCFNFNLKIFSGEKITKLF